MNRQLPFAEFLIVSTAAGLVATFAAPWIELRGTYAAWRISEWHTFWRGEGAFQLASVVASSYRVPVEYATVEMKETLRHLFALGSALGMWYVGVVLVLLAVGARRRSESGRSRTSVVLETLALVLVNALLLALLIVLLALPSTLTPKVDFRTGSDLHTNSLVWSNLNILPLAPALSIAVVLAQWVALAIFLIRPKKGPI